MVALLVILVTALDIAFNSHVTHQGVVLWLPVLVVTAFAQEQWVPMLLWLIGLLVVQWFIPFPVWVLIGILPIALAAYWLRQRSFDATNFWLLGLLTALLAIPFVLLSGMTTWSSFLTTVGWAWGVATVAYAVPVLRRSPRHAY